MKRPYLCHKCPSSTHFICGNVAAISDGSAMQRKRLHMAGYILMDLEITDPEGFKEYLRLVGPSVKQYGGKVLAGGATCETLEGEWRPRQLSIGEFESIEQAL